MKRGTTLIVFGILLLILPFVGLPVAFRNVIVPVVGVLVAAIGISMRTRRAADVPAEAQVSAEA